MSIRREFLSCERPALVAAADYLLNRFATAGIAEMPVSGTGPVPLSDVVVAVPGGRAGRRLLELLVEEAARRHCALCPPQIVTVGHLPEKLYQPKRPFAKPLVQDLAWDAAIRQSNPGRVALLIPALATQGDLDARLALGKMLGRLHRELADGDKNFSEVVNEGRRLPHFPDGQRWQVLAEVQKAYLGILDGLGLWDEQTARHIAIRDEECAVKSPIVLLGTVDLNRLQRKMLEKVAGHVTALVFSPPELAERFDQYGCLRPEAWQDVPLPLAAGQIAVVDDPAAQAAEVVRTIAGWDGRYAAAEITIGVPDAQAVPYIERQLREHDIASRYVVGTPLLGTEPCSLLAAVAAYLDRGSVAALAALVRHPAVDRWLRDHGLIGDYLTEMDRYASSHFPRAPGEPWLGQPKEYAGMAAVHRACEELLAGFGPDAKPLPEWGAPIAELLVQVFGGAALDASDPRDRQLLAGCKKIRETLEGHVAAPAALVPAVHACEAIRLVLGQLEGDALPPPEADAVELLGWLELPLDDAPAMIVTGLNEGCVPASQNADPFLPNQLRGPLGIEDNERRYARDAYALTVLAASRRDVRVIAGRRSAAGDPQVPSRLLFACDAEEAAQRVLECFGPPRKSSAGVARGKLRAGQSQFAIQQPRPLTEPVTSMRVTEFRDYLACPFRYYLRHRLKLESFDDAAVELDGGLFGSLAHQVLREFGRSAAAAATDPEVVYRELGALLDKAADEMFGAAPLPAVAVQIEQLRLRLKPLAQWQAGWAAAGWKIHAVEASPAPGTACLQVDGRPMELRGRIDRIDLNEATGQAAVFDYKTSDTASPPEKTHRRGGQWIDLQLPLYRHLAQALGIAGPVQLGYILLPKDTTETGDKLAEWSDGDLAAADATAADVVRMVRAEKFWPPASPPPMFFDELAAICQEGQFGGMAAAALGEGENGV